MDDYSRLSPEDQRRLTDEMTRAFTSRPAPQPEPAPIVQPPPTPGIASGGILTEVEYERAEFTTAPGGVDIVRHALYRNPSGAEARGLLAPATRPFSVRPAPVVAPDTAHEAAGSPLSDDRGQTAIGQPSDDVGASQGILALADVLRDLALLGVVIWGAAVWVVALALIA